MKDTYEDIVTELIKKYHNMSIKDASRIASDPDFGPPTLAMIISRLESNEALAKAELHSEKLKYLNKQAQTNVGIYD